MRQTPAPLSDYVVRRPPSDYARARRTTRGARHRVILRSPTGWGRRVTSLREVKGCDTPCRGWTPNGGGLTPPAYVVRGTRCGDQPMPG